MKTELADAVSQANHLAGILDREWVEVFFSTHSSNQEDYGQPKLSVRFSDKLKPEE
jgi:hypothetical protein